jgi:hypothetical protein
LVPRALRRCAFRARQGAEAVTRAVQRFQVIFIKAKSSARLLRCLFGYAVCHCG